MHKRLLRTSLIALSCLTIAGCGSMMTREADRTAGMSAPQLYQEARDNVRSNDYKTARTYLEAVESRYPYSSFAQQSLIDQAYVNWKDNEPEKAVTAIDRFLRLYPSHPGTDYMLYLKGLVTFTPPSSYLRSLTGQDPSERDPKGLRQSYDAFNELVERFPDSRYSRDARQRITWLVSTIADNEVNVARYYYTRHAYVAAINRSQAVLKDFSGVAAAEPALYIMMQSYQQLGMQDQANDAKRVLDQNYPNSKYYELGVDGEKGGWLSWLSPARVFN